MGMFICDKCGCAENTALGVYWSRNRNLFGPEYAGMALCSVCAPTTYRDGTKPRKFNGEWHDKFPRIFPTEEEIIDKLKNNPMAYENRKLKNGKLIKL